MYKIFLVEKDVVEKDLDSNFAHAFISDSSQSIVAEWHGSDIGLSLLLSHELFHARSPKYTNHNIRREGMSLRTGAMYGSVKQEGLNLGILEEAIVETLTIEFYETVVRKHPFFKKKCTRQTSLSNGSSGFVRREAKIFK